MTKYALFGALVVLSIVPLAPAQVGANSANRILLGRFTNGAGVAFVRSGSGDWGIEIFGDSVSLLTQEKPAQIEVYRDDQNVHDFSAGYQSLQRETGAVLAKAIVAGGGDAAFAVEDRWKIAGNVLSLERKVRVTGGNTGFIRRSGSRPRPQ